MGSSRKGIFKQRSSTGREAYANKFVSLSSVCTLIETIFQKNLSKTTAQECKKRTFRYVRGTEMPFPKLSNKKY